jgi:hypothetical protein
MLLFLDIVIKKATIKLSNSFLLNGNNSALKFMMVQAAG